MNLNQLPKLKSRTNKRLGRGAGSGKGKTSGRGQKGQAARGTVKLLFEGGQLSLIKRLPLLRGKGINKPHLNKPLVVNIKYLNLLPQQSVVNVAALLKNNIIKDILGDKTKVKILGEGKLNKVLTVVIPCSKGAAKKIIAAGGKVTTETEIKKPAKSKSTKTVKK